nr:MAG TPA: holin [Caudoviricetes sp.]
MEVMNKANVFWATVVTVLSAVLGKYWFLFVGFLMLNVLDYASGTYRDYMKHKLSSAVGAKGIAKKVWYWAVIGVAFYVSYAFASMGDLLGINLKWIVVIGWFTLACYLVNELRSFLENLIEIGVKVPSVLIKGLEITEKLLNEKEEHIEEENHEGC